MSPFYLLFIFVIGQRIIELGIASSNERWMKRRGGVEIGEAHHKWFIILHLLFFIAVLCEYHVKYAKVELLPFYSIFFIGFIIAQIGRIWCIYSLGRCWNTDIIVLPQVALIKKGPYKYLQHPNNNLVFI